MGNNICKPHVIVPEEILEIPIILKNIKEHQIRFYACLVPTNDILLDFNPDTCNYVSDIIDWYYNQFEILELSNCIRGFILKEIEFRIEGLDNYFVITYYTHKSVDDDDKAILNFLVDPDIDERHPITIPEYGPCLVIGSKDSFIKIY